MILTIGNNKGGVGKTALAAHLAFRAAERMRVLAVDLDAQGNFSATLVARGSYRPGAALAEHLFGDAQPEPVATGITNLDLLAASRSLTGIDRLDLSAGLQAIVHLKALAKCYHLVLIDTAPALGLRLTTALAAAQQVLVPMVPESYAVDGVATVLAEIASIGENLNPAMQPPRFVLNLMSPQGRQHRRIAERIASSVDVLEPWLNRSVAVADALAERRPVWRGGSAKAAAQWRTLCDHILASAAPGIPA